MKIFKGIISDIVSWVKKSPSPLSRFARITVIALGVFLALAVIIECTNGIL